MKEKIAIYPGTFDPITNGHLSIIRRGLDIFDKIIVSILINPKKNPLFAVEERVYMIKEATKDMGGRVEVDTFEGLLMDYAVKKGAKAIIRGLRAMSDFEFEFQMALMNRKLNRAVQSIFLMTDYKWLYTSSSIVKEVASFGGDVKGLVPDIVYRKLRERFREKFEGNA